MLRPWQTSGQDRTGDATVPSHSYSHPKICHLTPALTKKDAGHEYPFYRSCARHLPTAKVAAGVLSKDAFHLYWQTGRNRDTVHPSILSTRSCICLDCAKHIGQYGPPTCECLKGRCGPKLGASKHTRCCAIATQYVCRSLLWFPLAWAGTPELTCPSSAAFAAPCSSQQPWGTSCRTRSPTPATLVSRDQACALLGQLPC